MTVILAVGNELRGDDGVGIFAGRILANKGFPVIFAHESPENIIGELKRYEKLIVVDAAHFESDSPFKVSKEFEESFYSHSVGLSKIRKFTGAEILLVGIKTYKHGLMEGISERAKQNALEAVKVVEVCMAIPGKVLGRGLVEINGKEKKAKFAVPNLSRGDFVLVHAGVVIQKLSEDEFQSIKNSCDI